MAEPRTREDIERDIVSKRRERVLYVSPQGVAKCHADLDRLLDEWELVNALGSERPEQPEVPHA